MPSERRDVTAGLPRKRMAAGLLLTDADERVLLVEPVYKAGWEIPGGCVEADESPYQAAIRECREELGLDLAPGRLLVVDWVPARAGRTEGVMVVYDCGTLDPRVHERIVVPPGQGSGKVPIWPFQSSPSSWSGRYGFRLLWRRAAAMVVMPVSRSRLIAVLRRVAMARGALPVRRRLASSA